MHIFVRMTNHIIIGFRNADLCTNDYFVPNFFPMRFCKTVIFRAQWCLSSHGEFLCVFSSNVSVSPSAQCSPMREWRGAVNAL